MGSMARGLAKKSLRSNDLRSALLGFFTPQLARVSKMRIERDVGLYFLMEI
jgi:hypothetical protein